ncbi:MAG: sensor histidine kinase [Eubacteriales bacterium]|nr:sensor histidine kinase [Eubacteriales bacterium]
MKKWINKSFGRRIAAFFIPAVTALILIIAGVNYYIYYSAFSKEIQGNIERIVTQGNYTIDLYFQDIKTTVALLADDDDLLYMLTNYEDMSLQERFYQQEAIDQALRNTSLMRSHIMDCLIVGVNGYQTNMPDRYALKNGIRILEEDWMKDSVDNSDHRFFFTGAHPADYYYGRNVVSNNVISVIYPVERYGELLGYIIVDLDFQKMNDIISEGNNVDGLNFLVSDSDGRIVFSGEQEEINTQLPAEATEKLGEKKAFSFSFRGTEFFCTHEKSSTTQWEFLGLISKDNIARPVMRILRILVFLVLPCSIFMAVVLSVVISIRVKEPLEELIDQIEQVDIDDPKPFTVRNSVGEIEYLAEKITGMSRKITNLINQVYKAEIKSKDAQIEALISQINPHFLYNTLQLIKTESMKGKPQEVSDTVNCLSRFLRYTINNRKLFVPLSDELEYIRVYVEIYKKRFPGKYELRIQAEEELKEIAIPKLTLQPIVENAIKHGLSGKEGAGMISITAVGGEDLLIIIEDDGVGMEEEAIEKLLAYIHTPDDSGEHVGLRNIQERLTLGNGEGYGIVKIESEPGKNFRMYVKIKRG